MKRYQLTRSAQDDLIGHLEYLTERSQVAAERLALNLMREFRFLAEWPGSGRLRPEVTNADVGSGLWVTICLFIARQLWAL
jgi:plasmid stabilization system protein ParE